MWSKFQHSGSTGPSGKARPVNYEACCESDEIPNTGKKKNLGNLSDNSDWFPLI
jgi:hypothetical protein